MNDSQYNSEILSAYSQLHWNLSSFICFICSNFSLQISWISVWALPHSPLFFAPGRAIALTDGAQKGRKTQSQTTTQNRLPYQHFLCKQQEHKQQREYPQISARLVLQPSNILKANFPGECLIPGLPLHIFFPACPICILSDTSHHFLWHAQPGKSHILG